MGRTDAKMLRFFRYFIVVNLFMLAILLLFAWMI
jgi:hypothetical protein